jgi:sarcosine oxidase subunit gamma
MTEALTQHHALEHFLASVSSAAAGNSGLLVEIDLKARFINVRGDPADKAFLSAIGTTCQLALPLEANTCDGDDPRVFWLGPDEWLLQHRGDGSALFESLRTEILDTTASLTDLSDAYVSFLVSGDGVRELLAKGCTLDLHPGSFTGNACAQTLLARADVLLAAMPADTSLQLLVRRTFAEYLASWLGHAAGTGARLSVRD